MNPLFNTMNDKLRQLLTQLLAKTESNSVRWVEVDNGIYRVEVGGGLVRISPEYSESDNDDDTKRARYVVTVSDAFGRIVEEHTTRSSMLEMLDYQLLDNLYKASRRSALNTDGILEQMLGSLKANK